MTGTSWRWGGGVIVALWILFYLSSSAVLIWSNRLVRAPGEGQDYLVCTYFTGLGVIDREFWYSANGVMGRAACPRLISL